MSTSPSYNQCFAVLVKFQIKVQIKIQLQIQL